MYIVLYYTIRVNHLKNVSAMFEYQMTSLYNLKYQQKDKVMKVERQTDSLMFFNIDINRYLSLLRDVAIAPSYRNMLIMKGEKKSAVMYIHEYRNSLHRRRLHRPFLFSYKFEIDF